MYYEKCKGGNMGQSTLDRYLEAKKIEYSSPELEFNILSKNLDPELVTFKGKFKHPIHSWFRLTPSYSPELVRILLSELKIPGQGGIVLDPFAGTGTTLLECKREGIRSIGVEINPVFYRVIRASINWDKLDPDYLETIVTRFFKKASELSYKFQPIPITKFDVHGIPLPKISNVFRWWDPEILKQLLVIREAFKQYSVELSQEYQDFLWVGIASILLEVANVKRNHPTISFADNPFNQRLSNKRSSKKNIDVWSILKQRYKKMITDVKLVQASTLNPAPARVILGDSRQLGTLLPPEYRGEIMGVITSPPYPNRYSYVMETRPYLYFFEIFERPAQASELDLRTIGGTWGRATFSLKNKRIKPINSIVDEVLGDIPEMIYSHSDILSNYVVKYFNDMYLHFESLLEVLDPYNGRLAYVIGNSFIKGVEVPSDIIIARILKHLGFKIDKIWHLRKRGGRKGLYEAVTFAYYG